MKITHNKEHCFLAVWALQQYGGPRVADADDENDDARGAKKKHSDDEHGPAPILVGEDPRLRDGGLTILRSEMSDGPPRVQEAEIEKYHDGTFSVCDLLEAVLKTKSHKGENWYEMYGKVSINSTEDAVFLDLDFDYGS